MCCSSPLLIKGLYHLWHCNHYQPAEQNLLMLHRGRDTSAVCLGITQRNIQLLISPLPYLILLKPPGDIDKHTTGHELPKLLETASNQRLFYLHDKRCTWLLPPEKEGSGGRRILHGYYSHMHRSLSWLRALLSPVTS